MEVSGQLHVSASVAGETEPDTHSVGDFVGPITCLDAVEKRKRFALPKPNRISQQSPSPSSSQRG
jgi:hypothetical protein